MFFLILECSPLFDEKEFNSHQCWVEPQTRSGRYLKLTKTETLTCELLEENTDSLGSASVSPMDEEEIKADLI